MSTCSALTSPSRCAAARYGRTGASGCPVIDIRPLSASAARTRRPASAIEIRSVAANARGNVEWHSSPARSRRCASRTDWWSASESRFRNRSKPCR